MILAPDTAPDSFRHPHLGEPDQIWCYRDKHGKPFFYVCRFVSENGGKNIRPLSCWQDKTGKHQWEWKHLPAPRPLYGLYSLAWNPYAPVLVVEGEKTADAAQQLFPEMVVVTSPCGSDAAEKAIWDPFKGRDVFIWPDHDQPGREYADAVAEIALAAGANSVRIVEVPDEFPEKWDLADELPVGVTGSRIFQLVKEAHPFSKDQTKKDLPPVSPPDWPFRVDEQGVFKKVETTKAPGETKVEWIKVCSRLDVVARTRDSGGKSWGRLLAVTTREGQTNEWAMPMELLAGDGTAYRAELLKLGLEISPETRARYALHEYINDASPQEWARCVDRLGWHGQVFVLPNQTYGNGQDERVLFQVDRVSDDLFRVKGELEEWKEQIAKLCAGNSRLAFAVSAAFAAPLLHPASLEGGGFHLRGGSSIGKTTALQVAGSVWGGGGVNGYCQSWRATSNGLEAVGVAHCDTLLCLDEMSQINGQDAGQTAYMLSNGQGKSRARKDGTGRPPAQWRLLFLSTGELSLADKVNESGGRASAGQEVRMVDIPADAGASLGIFEDLHDFDSPAALADHLRLNSIQNYGSPARKFLERITTNPEHLTEQLRRARQEFLDKHCPRTADGQVTRVANRFALVAAAGCLATAMGILPWGGDEALKSAGTCFTAWLNQRGGFGSLEEQAGIEAVRRFIQAHGKSRFQSCNGDYDRPIINRAGFVRDGQQGREYLIFPETFRNEICKGMDSKRVLDHLKDRGLLIPDSTGRPARVVRLPSFDDPIRMYVLKNEILGESGDD